MKVTSDEYYLMLAYIASIRSTCPRAHVGSVIVKNGSVKSTGYNGAPKGAPHCTEVGCFLDQDAHCIASVHAEVNSIIQANESVDGATMYTTHFPCIECCKVIVNAKISRIVYLFEYTDTRSKLYMAQKKLLSLGNISVEKIDPHIFIESLSSSLKLVSEHVKIA